MTISRFSQIFIFMAMVAFLVCGQQALAQVNHHLQMQVVSGPHADRAEARSEKKVLEQLASGFGVLPPLDGGGNDEWPCSSTFNNAADCSQIAPGGVVLGSPAYTQSLANCDNSGPTYVSCGQIFWFYEDDTNDNIDDLVVSVVVKQGKNYILDSGPMNHGANPYSPGTVILSSLDTSFGTVGQSGPSNGNCAGSTETCVNPVKGVATVTITTTVGTSTISSKFNMFLE